MASVKEQMKRLWQNTFHDSKEYLDLVFSEYFNPDLIACHEEKGEIVASLIGIPYDFVRNQSKIRALYLCGLATDNNYRNRGIMSSLIDELAQKVKNDYDLLFLIPADEELIEFYLRRGFHRAIYRVKEFYTSVHDFYNEFKALILEDDERVKFLKEELYDSLKIENFDSSDSLSQENIISFLIKKERTENFGFVLQHSDRDFKSIIFENRINGGEIFFAYNKDTEITGVAITEDREGIRVIPHLYCEDKCSYFKLLNHIKKKFQEESLVIYKFPEEISRKGIADNYYFGENPINTNLESVFSLNEEVLNLSSYLEKTYGMAKILNFKNVLQALVQEQPRIKFKIILKNSEEMALSFHIEAKNGKIEIREIGIEQQHDLQKKGILSFTPSKLSALLFRKKGKTNLIMEILGLPRLSLNMAYLLD